MKTLHGTSASRGIAIGPVFQYRQPTLTIPRSKISDSEAELARLHLALDTACAQLADIYEKAIVEVGMDKAEIFQAQTEMLQDPELLESVQQAISVERQNAEAALFDAAEVYAATLENMGSEYFRARAGDIRDAVQRVLRILTNVQENARNALKQPSIVVAVDLAPSDTINFDKKLLLGFAIVMGGPTSHTAILARSLGLPAAVGMEDGILSLPTGSEIIVDGSRGELHTECSPELLASYRERQAANRAFSADLQVNAHQPAITRDGHRVEVVANVGKVDEAAPAVALGAEGVGLLRSEFLYLQRETLPNEEEQYQAYRGILDAFGEQPVVLRTLDVGGDKELPYMDIAQEINPFLGVRAVRLCLKRPDLFRPQLRAALRAGVGRNLKIMFPMIATLAELRAAKKALTECRAELNREGVATADNIEVGVMVEIPAAVIMADFLAREADFFSIGTNDLTQYVMAADRTNPGVAELTSAFAPPVLRMIAQTIASGHQAGRWVGLCGELAGEPLAIPILLGLGLDEFSMNAPAIPLAKQIIRSLDYSHCQAAAREVLNLTDEKEVRDYISQTFPVINDLVI